MLLFRVLEATLVNMPFSSITLCLYLCSYLLLQCAQPTTSDCINFLMKWKCTSCCWWYWVLMCVCVCLCVYEWLQCYNCSKCMATLSFSAIFFIVLFNIDQLTMYQVFAVWHDAIASQFENAHNYWDLSILLFISFFFFIIIIVVFFLRSHHVVCFIYSFLSWMCAVCANARTRLFFYPRFKEQFQV